MKAWSCIRLPPTCGGYDQLPQKMSSNLNGFKKCLYHIDHVIYSIARLWMVLIGGKPSFQVGTPPLTECSNMCIYIYMCVMSSMKDANGRNVTSKWKVHHVSIHFLLEKEDSYRYLNLWK